MAANHATNYSYKNCSFCIINYFEILLKTLQNTNFSPLCGCLCMMMMMMVIIKWLCKRKKNWLYGPFGPILTILAAENVKTKK